MKVMKAALIASVAAAAVCASIQGALAEDSIYSHLPNTALTGLVDPNMADRTDIPKAWPKTPADAKNIKVGMIMWILDNPWFAGVGAGAKRAADQYGMSLDLQVGPTVNDECSLIDNFITKQVDIIAIDSVDPVGIVKCINRAVDAGIPVVGMSGSPGADARVLTTISADPYGTALMTGEYIAQSMGTDTPIVAAALAGNVGNTVSDGRINGMITGMVIERAKQLNLGLTKDQAMLRGFNLFQTLASSGTAEDAELKLKLVAMGEGLWSLDGGLKASEDILQANQDELNLIIAANDFMGLGALKAVRSLGKEGQIKIGSPADGFREGLEELKAGNMLVNGENSGDKQGVSIIEFVNSIFNEGLDPNNLPFASTFPPAIITAENVDAKIDPDTSNPFFKYELTPVISIPELKAKLAAEAN